jgi:hypothetical protein
VAAVLPNCNRLRSDKRRRRGKLDCATFPLRCRKRNQEERPTVHLLSVRQSTLFSRQISNNSIGIFYPSLDRLDQKLDQIKVKSNTTSISRNKVESLHSAQQSTSRVSSHRDTGIASPTNQTAHFQLSRDVSSEHDIAKESIPRHRACFWRERRRLGIPKTL